MSDKARYGISLAMGWAVGAVYAAWVFASGLQHEPSAMAGGFVLTFGVTIAAANILKGGGR